MKFVVYQIVLTDKRYNDWNANRDTEGYKMYLDTTVAPTPEKIETAWDAGMYTKVAVIEANNFEDAFRVGNLGPEEQIERFDQMHSLSVGDILIDENDDAHVVASFGFKPITRKAEAA